MGREEHCKQILLACVGSANSVLAALGLPPLMVCVLSCFYTSQALGCSSGELSEAGPGLCAVPRSKPLRFRFSGTPQRCRLSWACILGPSQVHAAQVTRCLARTVFPQVGGASYGLLHPSCSVFWVHSESSVSDGLCISSGELISGCNPPGGCQPSRIPRTLG